VVRGLPPRPFGPGAGAEWPLSSRRPRCAVDRRPEAEHRRRGRQPRDRPPRTAGLCGRVWRARGRGRWMGQRGRHRATAGHVRGDVGLAGVDRRPPGGRVETPRAGRRGVRCLVPISTGVGLGK